MKSNPYQSPSADLQSSGEIRPRRFHDGRFAAGILVLLAASAICFDLAYLWSSWLRQPVTSNFGSLNGKLLLFTLGHFIVLHGSLLHLRHRTNAWVLTAAVIATIPIVTPWFILGCPFGLRMLVAKIQSRNHPNNSW